MDITTNICRENVIFVSKHLSEFNGFAGTHRYLIKNDKFVEHKSMFLVNLNCVSIIFLLDS